MTEEVNTALKAMPFLFFYFSRVNLSIFSWNFLFRLHCVVSVGGHERALCLSNTSLEPPHEPQIHSYESSCSVRDNKKKV